MSTVEAARAAAAEDVTGVRNVTALNQGRSSCGLNENCICVYLPESHLSRTLLTAF